PYRGALAMKVLGDCGVFFCLLNNNLFKSRKSTGNPTRTAPQPAANPASAHQIHKKRQINEKYLEFFLSAASKLDTLSSRG
ncbi:MAG: hypothetical protein RR739_10045, partial [Clostridia bacterium]